MIQCHYVLLLLTGAVLSQPASNDAKQGSLKQIRTPRGGRQYDYYSSNGYEDELEYTSDEKDSLAYASHSSGEDLLRRKRVPNTLEERVVFDGHGNVLIKDVVDRNANAPQENDKQSTKDSARTRRDLAYDRQIEIDREVLEVAETHIFRPLFRYKAQIAERRQVPRK